MSFLGSGPIELVVVLLVAFIVLGPERMVDTARLMGKGIREVRRMTASLSDVVIEDFSEPATATGTGQDRSETATATGAGSDKVDDGARRQNAQNEPGAGPENAGDAGSQTTDEGPVAFRPAGKAPPEAPDEPDAPDSPGSPGSPGSKDGA